MCDVVATQLGAQVVELLGVGPAPSRTPEDLLVSTEARARATLALRRALESLEPRERAFVHGYFDGGTLDELAPRLDLPVIAVRRMRKKVETVLWKRLKAQGVDEAPTSSANS